MIQSIEYTCENGNPADTGESGESGPTGPGVGAGIDLGAYFSIPFISIGYQYYETEDDLDPNYQHYLGVVNYFSSLGTTLNQLRVSNPDLFYYTFFYFKDNGINPTTKAFISQRLNGLNAWYVAVNNNPNSIPTNNQYFLNWAYEYLVLNPDVTWEEFYEEYLATPCDKIKTQRTNTDFKNNITNLQGKTNLKKETGYIQRTDELYTYMNNASATNNANELKLPNIALPENKNIKAYMHTHVNDYTYDNPTEPGTITKQGFKIFSPADIVYFMDMVKSGHDAGRSLEDIYAVMVSSQKNYQIRFTGTAFQIKTFTDNQTDAFRESFKKFMPDYNKNAKARELGFLKFLSENMNVNGISLYRMNSDGKTTEIKLNATKTDTTEINCPQ